jgi:hypothetical protein
MPHLLYSTEHSLLCFVSSRVDSGSGSESKTIETSGEYFQRLQHAAAPPAPAAPAAVPAHQIRLSFRLHSCRARACA